MGLLQTCELQYKRKPKVLTSLLCIREENGGRSKGTTTLRRTKLLEVEALSSHV